MSGDGAVREAFGHETKDLALTGRQLAERTLATPAADEPRDDRRVDHGLSVGDPPQRVDEDCDVEDALLEQVADPFRMLLEQPQRIARLDVVREDKHADRGMLLTDLLRDRKSTRLNSSHVKISYAVFCL